MNALASILSGADPGGRAAWRNLARALPQDEVSRARRAILQPQGKTAAATDARYGAVACGSPHATQVGIELLEAGGNAADAAAGAAFAMMVADPANASPAGRAHIIWDRPGQKAQAMDGATRAPSRLPEGLHRLPDAQALPLPGAVRAILALHARAGRLPIAAVAGRARDLAEGYAVPEPLARIWAWRAPEIADADARRVYLPGGRPPGAGESFRQPGLAAFFDRLAQTGADPFADAAFAEGFCRRLAGKGAFWTAPDLRAAEPLDGETVAFDGDGWRLVSIGRQGWGHTLLRIVTLVASADAATDEEAELAHLLAVLRAFEERPEELRSLKPKPEMIPWEALSARLGERMATDWRTAPALTRAIRRVQASAAGDERDTTHLSVIDAEGMRVALTQSIGPHFGARVADPETGILIAHSYRMAEATSPGARDVTEQCPCLLDLGPGRYALGGAGSERIPGAVAAVIRGLLTGHDLADAIAAPRCNWVGDIVRMHVDAPPGLDDRLAEAGAQISFTDRGPVDHLGIVQAAGRDRNGRLVAAADPAYAGTAAAQ